MWQGIKNIYHFFVAILANIWYGFPARDLTVIGITGTDGKTTTASLIYHILHSSGEKAAMITTLGVFTKNATYDTGHHTTTPSSFYLQKYIKKIRYEGYKYLVLEVTSHALDQNRVFGISFKIGVLTNITHEHLDYHKTYENYAAVKLRLLKIAEVAIVNRDDESYRLISNIKYQISKTRPITYGFGKEADVNLQNFTFQTKLLGEFNKYNILAAAAVCKELGISEKDIKKSIETFKPPLGRQDIIYDKKFKVMIDFAHTPHAFHQILPVCKKLSKGAKMIHVFGAAGERDGSKRSLMGKISSDFSDIIILTSEDPRSEKVEKIIKEIESGIQNYESRIKDKKLFAIPNRQEAINFAVSLASAGDVIVITGKGHEQSMNLGHGEEPWSEYEAVKKALSLRRGTVYEKS